MVNLINLYRGLRDVVVHERMLLDYVDDGYHAEALASYIGVITDAIEEDYGRFGRFCCRVAVRIFV